MRRQVQEKANNFGGLVFGFDEADMFAIWGNFLWPLKDWHFGYICNGCSKLWSFKISNFESRDQVIAKLPNSKQMFHDYTFVLNIFCLLDLKTNYFARRMNIRKQKMMDEGQKKDVGELPRGRRFFCGERRFLLVGEEEEKGLEEFKILVPDSL